MHGAREFRLELCANASDRIVKYATEMLENIGEAERAKGAGLPPLRAIDHRSSIITEIWSPRSRVMDDRAESVVRWPVRASAL